MFEGWASEFLAASLGRFVDVQRDKLRISLWSGSGVLENVRLRAEAFDYLNLPFAIHDGVVGRLRIKIPWGNWLTGSLVVELSDVVLCAAERADTEWEEAASLRREQAAKQADLAAAELAKLSRRVVAQQQKQEQASQQQHSNFQGGSAPATDRNLAAAGQRGSHGGVASGVAAAADSLTVAAGGAPAAATPACTVDAEACSHSAEAAPAGGAAGAPAAGAGAGSAGGGGSFGGSLLSAAMQYVSQFLLNRLQFSVRNVHIAFRGCQDGVPFSAGLALDSLSTVPEPKPPKSVLARLYGAALSRHSHAKLARHIAIRGLGIYWHAPRPGATTQPGPAGACAAPLPLHHPDDYIIRPLDSLLRITVVAAGGGSLGPSAQHTLHIQHQIAVSSGQTAATASGSVTSLGGVGEGAVAPAAGSRHNSVGSGIRTLAGQHLYQAQAHRNFANHHQLPQSTAAAGSSTPAVGASGVAAGGTHVEVIAGTDAVQIQVRPEQLQSMAQLADDLAVWTKRNRYGRFRPPGWRTAAQAQRARADAAAAAAYGTAAATSSSGSGAGAEMSRSPPIQRSSSDPGRIQVLVRPVLQSVQEEDEGQASMGAAGRRVAQMKPSGLKGPFDAVDSVGDGAIEDDTEAYSSPSPSRLSCQRAYASSAALLNADVGAAPSVPEGKAGLLTGVLDGGDPGGPDGHDSGSSSTADVARQGGSKSVSPEAKCGAAESRGLRESMRVPVRAQAMRTPGSPSDTQTAEAAGSTPLVVPTSPAGAGACVVRWVHVWQYAIRAMLHDVRERRGTGSLRDYLQYKRKYMQLYRRKLEYLKQAGDSGGGGGSSNSSSGSVSTAAGSATTLPIVPVVAPQLSTAEEFVELQRLEAYLSVADILTFRQLTERALEDEQEHERAAAAFTASGGSGGSTDAVSAGELQHGAEALPHRSWLAWGLSGLSGFFMYGSGGGGGPKAAAASAVPQAPLSDAELAELYRLLQGTSLPTTEAAYVHPPGRHHHHHHHHHQQQQPQQQHSHQGPPAQLHHQGYATGSSGVAATMPIVLQFRVMQLTLDIKGPCVAHLAGRQKAHEGGITGGATSGGVAVSPTSWTPASANTSPASTASQVLGVCDGGPASEPTLLSLVLGSSALMLESDGCGTTLQVSIGTLHAYDMCPGAGVPECILSQADDLDLEVPGNASGGGRAGFGDLSRVGEAGQHGRRVATHGSWASLGQLLSGTAGRSAGLHSSVSTDSLDSDAGHWAMGYQSQTGQAPHQMDTWYGGPPMVVLQQGFGAGADLVEIHVRPLRLLYRARCFAAVGAAVAVDLSASLEHHTMHAIAGFEAQDARVLALLQHLRYLAPSRKLRLQIAGFEVVMALEEAPSPGGAAGSGASGNVPGAPTPMDDLSVRGGELAVGFYGIELVSITGVPPPQLAENASSLQKGGEECMDIPTCGEGSSSGATSGGLDGQSVMEDNASAACPGVALRGRDLGESKYAPLNSESVQRLQQLMQRKLTPSSTMTDLALIAAEGAGLGIGSRKPSCGVVAEDPDAALGVSCPDGLMGLPHDPQIDFARSQAAGKPCTVDNLARLFLYEHMHFTVHGVRASYRLPSAGVPSTAKGRLVAPLKSARQQQHTLRRQSSGPLRGTVTRPLQLLPRGLQLNGYFSRSRLEQGASSAASLLQLSLKGLSTTVKSSEVADLQRLAHCMSYSNAQDASPKLPVVPSAASIDHAVPGSASCQVPWAPQQSDGAIPRSGASGTPTVSTAPVQEAAAIAASPPPPPPPPPPGTAAAVLTGRIGTSLPTRSVECPHGTHNLVVAESGMGPTEGAVPPAVSAAAAIATGHSCLSAGVSQPTGLAQVSCARSAPTSPLLRAETPAPIFSVESANSVESGPVCRDSAAVEPCSSRMGRRPSLGDGQGTLGATRVAWGEAALQPTLRTSTSSAGISNPVESAVAPLTPLFGDAVEWEEHTDTVGTGSTNLRLPPLPRITCLLLCIEPFVVKYEPDGATESEWDSATASSTAAPALIIRASERTDICAVHSSSSSAGAASAIATDLSLQLHGVKIDVVTPRLPTSSASPDLNPSRNAAFWSLARTICIASLSASAIMNPKGSLSACGAIRGVRLLGSTDQPGHFLLSNGPGQDDAKVTFRYWSADSDPPPDPAEAAAAAAACVSAGWWHPSTQESSAQKLSTSIGGFASNYMDSGADGSQQARSAHAKRPSGGPEELSGDCKDGVDGSGVAGGVALVVSDVAVGLGLLTSLAFVCSSIPSASRTGEDAAARGGRSVQAVQRQPQGALAAQSSSSAAADGPLAPLAVEVQLRNCAILAISPSRTPFAAASGGSGHLACNALLSIEEVSYDLGPHPVVRSVAAPAPVAPSSPQDSYCPAKSVLNPQTPSAVAAEGVDVGSTAAPGAGMGVGPHEVAQEPAVSHRASVKGLLLYLADNPDSAYLSPVLLLPELRASYIPVAAAVAAGDTCGGITINDHGVGFAPGMSSRGQQLGAAAAAGAGQGQAGQLLEAMALSIDVGQVEANLQPQQVGVLCSLLAEMPTSAKSDTPPLQADQMTVQSQRQQKRMTVRQNLGTAPKRLEAQLANTASPIRQPDDELLAPPTLPVDLGKDLAASLPYLALSVKLSSLTALLGSDTLSEEATVLHWGGVRLSYCRTKVDIESSLAWQGLTLSSISSRLNPAHVGLVAAMQDTAVGSGECCANDAAAAAAEFKIHASSLALMYELTSYFHSTQHNVPVAATDTRTASSETPNPVAALRSPPVRLPPSGDSIAAAVHPSQLLCTPPVALTQLPGFGTSPRGSSMQQLIDGGGGGADADAEFYSVEGSSVVLDDLDVVGGADSEEQDLVNLDDHQHMGWQGPDGAGPLAPPNAGTAAARMSRPGAGGRDRIGMGDAISPDGSGSGGRRGIVLRARVFPDKRITRPIIAALPAAHLPFVAAAADVRASPSEKKDGTGPESFRGAATCSHAPEAVILVSASAPCCSAGSLTADSTTDFCAIATDAAGAACAHGRDVAASQLVTLLVRIQLSGGPLHRNALQSSAKLANRQPSTSPSSGFGASSDGLTSFASEHCELSRGPTATGDGYTPLGPAGPADGNITPSPSQPHFDVDLSGLHVLVSLTQWYRLLDSLAACDRHWRTAAVGQQRARMRQRQLGALAARQQGQQQQYRQGQQQLFPPSHALPTVSPRGLQKTNSLDAACAPLAAPSCSHPAVMAVNTATVEATAATAAAAPAPQGFAAAVTGDPSVGAGCADACTTHMDGLLQLLLQLPATASLSVQDVTIVAYSASELFSTGGAGRTVHGGVEGPESAPGSERGGPHSRQAAEPAAAEAAVVARHQLKQQRCVRFEFVMGASLEACTGGCLDRLTLVLPEVSVSTGLLVLGHDPRFGTWHDISDTWLLALLEGLSCAAVPHIHRSLQAVPEVMDEEHGQGPRLARYGVKKAGNRGLMTVTSAAPAMLHGDIGAPCVPRRDTTAPLPRSPPLPLPLTHAESTATVATEATMALRSIALRQGSVTGPGHDGRSEVEGGVCSLRLPHSNGGRAGGRALASGKGGAGVEDVVVHALLEASLRRASLYASRHALLHVLGLAFDTLESWARVAAATDRRRAHEGSDTEADEAGVEGDAGGDSPGYGGRDTFGAQLLDERALCLVGSPGIAAIAATAASGPRVPSWSQSLRDSAVGGGGGGRNTLATKSTLPRDYQYNMWPHDVDDEPDVTARTAKSQLRGPEILYQYHSLPHYPAHHPHGRHGERRAPAGTPASRGSGDGAGAGAGAGGGPGDWLGVRLPAWLPLCCLTFRVGKAAAVVYTDMQGFNLPLFEAAIAPLEIQIKLSTLSDAGAATAADLASGAGTADPAAVVTTNSASADAGTQAPFARPSVPATQADQPATRSVVSIAAAVAAPAYVRQQRPSGNTVAHHSTDAAADGVFGFGFEAGHRFGLWHRHNNGNGRRRDGDGATQQAPNGIGTAISASRSLHPLVSSVHVLMDATVLLDVYNLDKLGWEPVLEPWAVQVLYMARRPRATAPPYRQPPRSTSPSSAAALQPALPTPTPPRQSINITTNTLLEATLSPGLISAALAVTQLAEELGRAMANPKTVAVDAIAPEAVAAVLHPDRRSASLPLSSALGHKRYASAGRPDDLASRPAEGTGRGVGREYIAYGPQVHGEPGGGPWCLSKGPKPDALPRLWLQNHLGQPVSFLRLEQRPHASFLAALGAVGAVDGVVTHSSLAIVDSVPQAGRRFAGRHVASLPLQYMQSPLSSTQPQQQDHHNDSRNLAKAPTFGGAISRAIDAPHLLHRRTILECAAPNETGTIKGNESEGARAGDGTSGGGSSGARVLYFRLCDCSTWLGPISCSAAPPARYYFSLPPAAAAPQAAAARAAAAVAAAPPPGLRLVCDVRPHFLCSRRLELRSNVRLRNESGLWISVGDWAAVAGFGSDGGSGAQVLQHTLAPGGSTWLSTSLLQQSPAVLAVRTASPMAFEDEDVPTPDAHLAGVPEDSAGSSRSTGRTGLRFRSVGGSHSTGIAEHGLMKAQAATTCSSRASIQRPWSDWSIPIDLTSMLFDAVSQGLDNFAAGGGTAKRLGVARRVHCSLPSVRLPAGDAAAAADAGPTCHLIVHLAPVAAAAGGSGGGGGAVSQRPEWELVVMAPVVLRNDLPVPARFALQTYISGGNSAAAAAAPTVGPLPAPDLREFLPALASLHLHSFPAHRLVCVACRPVGYAWSSTQQVNCLLDGSAGSGDGFVPLHPGLEQPAAGGMGSGALVPRSEAALLIRPTQAGLQDLMLVLRTWQHSPTGQLRLELSCPVWIYNCTGLPVQLRPTARLVLPQGRPALVAAGGAASVAPTAGSASPPSPGLATGGGGSDSWDAAWVPPCMSLGGAPTLAAAAGPCTSQLAALQVAAGLFVAQTGRGAQASHSGHVDFAAVTRDAMSASGGGGVGAMTTNARSSSSVRSHCSIGGHTIASSGPNLGVGGGIAGGRGGRSSSGGGGGSGFGSTGLLVALAECGGSIAGDSVGGACSYGGLDDRGMQNGRGLAPDLFEVSPRTRHNGSSGIQGSTEAPVSGSFGSLGPDGAATNTSPVQMHAHAPTTRLTHPPQPPVEQHSSIDQMNPTRPAAKYDTSRAAPSSAEYSARHGVSFHTSSNLSRPQHDCFQPGGEAAGPSTASPPSTILPSACEFAYSRTDSPFNASGGGAIDARRSQALQPCMYGSMPVGVGQLELCVWHGGSGGWSPPIWPDVDGSPQCITLPCPLPDSDGGISPGGTAMSAVGAKGTGGGSRPAFHVVSRLAHVTLPTAAAGGGAVRSAALHLLPRYVVHNGLSAAVQVRQQGTSHTASLGLGERRPVHWADINLPLKLQIRIQDPGWSWSGGVAVDAVDPGDLFVKIRHRNRAETQLVRVDVSLSPAGSMLLSLSHHHTDFAPYRIDNCSGEALHVQQVGCLDQEDVIRPYACLPYTWDEHTAPQRVLVSLPGRRRLGEYELEKVGLSQSVSVVASQTGGHGRKILLITITADGPTRVLKVVDTGVHPAGALSSTGAIRTSTASPPKRRITSSRVGRGIVSSVDAASEIMGEEWQVEVSAALAGAAVSVVSEQAEVLYALAQGLHGTLLLGPAKVSASAVLQHVRWDNCLRFAVFPIVLYSPVGRSMFNTATMLPVPAPPSVVPPSGIETGIAVGPEAVTATAGHNGRGSPLGPQVNTAPHSNNALTLPGAPLSPRRSTSASTQHTTTAATGSPTASSDGGGGGGAKAHGSSAGAGRASGPPSTPPALAGRVVVWRNRPGGVTCVQYASVTAAPLAINIEETHLREVLRLAAQFSAAAAAVAASPAAALWEDSNCTIGTQSAAPAAAQSHREQSVPYVPDLSLLRPASPSLPGCSNQGFGSVGGGGSSTASAYAATGGAEAFPGDRGGDFTKRHPRAGRLSGAVGASSLPGAASGLAARSLLHVANAPGPTSPQAGGGGGDGRHSFIRHGATDPDNLRHQILTRSSKYVDRGAAAAPVDATGADGVPGPALRSRRIYIEELHIGEIRISASFAPRPYGGGGADATAAAADVNDGPEVDGDGYAPATVFGLPDVAADGDGGSGGLMDSAVRLAVSLAHLEGAWVLLRPLDMRYTLMRSEALVQNVCRHYMSCAMLELIKVVGSLDIFGDVVRLLQGLGLGVWHLISMPVAGALRGDMRKFAAGLAGGVGNMVRSVTYAASNSIVKASRRARTTLANLAPEPLLQPAGDGLNRRAVGTGMRSGRSRIDGTGPSGDSSDGGGGQIIPYGRRVSGGGAGGHAATGQRDLLLSIWEGYAAILQRVATEASRLSPAGTARELLMGSLGALALPSMAVLQIVEVTAASMRAAVSPRHGHGHGYGRNSAVRPRIPRYVDPAAPLQRYCWLEAMCRLLQREVRGGAFAEEVYMGGVQISDSNFAVVTRRHLLVASPRQLPPSTEWRAAHPSDLVVSLVLPLEGLVMVSTSNAAANSRRNWMPQLRPDGRGNSGGDNSETFGSAYKITQSSGAADGDDGNGGRMVCISHLQLEECPLRHHHRHYRRHHALSDHTIEHGMLRLKTPPPALPPQQLQQQPVGIAAALRAHMPSTGGTSGATASGHSDPARGIGNAASGTGSTGWTGHLFRLSSESGGPLLSLRYRQAMTAASGGGAAAHGAFVPVAHSAHIPTAASLRGVRVLGHGIREGSLAEEEEDEEAEDAQRTLPPSPWLCVTTLELSTKADAMRLVSLLEEVRRWYESQRGTGGCRMIGF